ncbi:OpgC domain-containing protein [Labrenzia sp. OB1]|uniref:OpgC family protein n=1 Tax=Labrenzia sp. OB1 TaxID=1561204 RepID=UPI000A66D2F4|nr:OpgC domain-containing protein [Labrenzia sp. OB1]
MNVHSQAKRPRDPRLDFFRGLGMFIIYIAHLPGNWWTLWIPARFGFSDATEIFVFCSGMASAIAFGKIFDVHGWAMGAARILHRMWQVYWAHIGQFLLIAVGLVMLHESNFLNSCCGLTQDYVASLNLWHLFNNTSVALPGLMTLTWVPNYFDILPMYVVILALIPLIMLASRISVIAAFALSIGLWLAAQFGLLDLPAEPWSDRKWFFNPFAWQMLFFTGFAFMRGWIPAPPVSRKLMALCAAIVIATIPFAYFRIHLNVEWIQEIRQSIRPLWIKTEFGLFRYIHFLALAYLAWIAVGERGKYLLGHGELWGLFVRVVQKVGQQSLAVFMASLVIAQAAGLLRDMVWGRGDWIPQILSNLLGFVALIAVAYTVSWYKSEPWRKPPATSGRGTSGRTTSAPEGQNTPAARDISDKKTDVMA